jgi:hypothetical protein
MAHCCNNASMIDVLLKTIFLVSFSKLESKFQSNTDRKTENANLPYFARDT